MTTATKTAKKQQEIKEIRSIAWNSFDIWLEDKEAAKCRKDIIGNAGKNYSYYDIKEYFCN